MLQQMISFSLHALQSLITTEMSFRHRKKSIRKVFKPRTNSIYRVNNILNIHNTTITGLAALIMAVVSPMVRI